MIMTDTLQNELPGLRISLTLAIQTEGAQKKVELPLKPLTVADFSDGIETKSLSERKKRNVNKNNFDCVLFEFTPEINLIVQNMLTGAGSEENSRQHFSCIKNFEPKQLFRRLPQIRTMQAMRKLLCYLKFIPLDSATFRKELKKILQDWALPQASCDKMITRACK